MPHYFSESSALTSGAVDRASSPGVTPPPLGGYLPFYSIFAKLANFREARKFANLHYEKPPNFAV
jgi:hypothetical protein